MSVEAYDAVVIGARVAGATVAALLGNAGCRVLLVDRARFPSPTLSTHFFRGAGLVAVLDRLGVLAGALALGAPPLRHTYRYVAGGRQPEISPPQDPGVLGFCLSVRREPLDAILLGRAARPTVEVRDRTRFLDLRTEDGRVTGVRLGTPGGDWVVRSRIVIGADGRQSAVARAVRAATEVEDPPIRAIYYRYLRDFPGPHGGAPDGAEFSRIDNELAYVFPSDDGVTCVALSVGLDAFAAIRSAPADRFRERLVAHRGLADRFAAATPAGKLLGCGPEPSFVRVPVGPGWALVGDAGLHQDPWSGRGMDAAGTHATYLAESLLAWFGGADSEARALADYHARRNAHGRPLYDQTVTIGRDLRQLSVD